MNNTDYLDVKEAKSLWKKNFANNVSDKMAGEIYAEDFLWHFCSYDKIYCIKGDKAREKFDSINKKSIFIFSQDDFDYDFVREIPSECVSGDFDDMWDVYVCDSNFAWCYINTHESQCGPYFVERQTESLKDLEG